MQKPIKTGFQNIRSRKKKVMFNSEWLTKMSVMDIVGLGSMQTVARMLEREDFKKDLKTSRT